MILTLTLQERFETYHAENPHVYKKLVEVARRWKARGFGRISVGGLVCIIRWEGDAMSISTDEQYKFNQNFASRYARLIIDQEPDLADLFETRKLRVA